MKTALLTAAAAVALTAVSFSGSAQAQCWFDGYSTRCAAAPAYPAYSYPSYGTPYAAWNSYDYRDYRYKPLWLPSYPGPRAGGH